MERKEEDGRTLCFLLNNGWLDYIYLEQKIKDYTYSWNCKFARKLQKHTDWYLPVVRQTVRFKGTVSKTAPFWHQLQVQGVLKTTLSFNNLLERLTELAKSFGLLQRKDTDQKDMAENLEGFQCKASGSLLCSHDVLRSQYWGVTESMELPTRELTWALVSTEFVLGLHYMDMMGDPWRWT